MSSWIRDMSADGYALTKHLETCSPPSAAERVAREAGVALGDPCTPGTRGEGACLTTQPGSARTSRPSAG